MGRCARIGARDCEQLLPVDFVVNQADCLELSFGHQSHFLDLRLATGWFLDQRVAVTVDAPLEQQKGKARMRVLFVTAWYPTRSNPTMGIFVREHAKAVALYDDVVVLHSAGFRPDMNDLWTLDVETDADLTEGLTTYRVWYGKWPILRTNALMTTYSVLRAFGGILSSGFHPDIVHANVFVTGVPSVLISRLRGVPVVITEHSSAFPRRLLGGNEIRKARLAFGAADAVMPVSEALKKAIESYSVKARFAVVPNVVNTALFRPAVASRWGDESKRLLFVGLMPETHVKGIPYLFQALRQLLQQRDDWHLDLVGDGPARGEYESLARGLGLADRVTFHGVQPKPAVAEFMRKSDIFVLPSLWENLPCVLIEAMASGLPVVSTRVGGIPEIVDETTGCLAAPGDASSLMTAIRDTMDSLHRFDRQEIARKAQRYSPEVVGRTIHEIYQACIDNRAARRQ